MTISYFRSSATEGISLTYQDLGNGPPLLLIHGFTGTASTNMGLLIENLYHDHRIIAPDLRGYGRSRPPNREFPADFYARDAADLANLLDHLQLPQVVVVGYSDGAESALLLAASRPDLVQGVVAWGVSGVISEAEVASVQSWLPVSEWGPDRDEWRAQIIDLHGEAQLGPLIEGWVSAAESILAAGGNICLRESVAIKCPVLLLNGDREVGNTVADVTRLAERISDCRLVFVANSGHAIQKDQLDELLHQTRKFLKQLKW